MFAVTDCRILACPCQHCDTAIVTTLGSTSETASASIQPQRKVFADIATDVALADAHWYGTQQLGNMLLQAR